MHVHAGVQVHHQVTEGIKFVKVSDALTWRKSRRSNGGGNCVELARLPEGTGVAIRNSRNPDGPALVFTQAEITAFVDGVRDGDFDDLVGRLSSLDDPPSA
jgi:hypothetical protein